MGLQTGASSLVVQSPGFTPIAVRLKFVIKRYPIAYRTDKNIPRSGLGIAEDDYSGLLNSGAVPVWASINFYDKCFGYGIKMTHP